MTQAVKRLIKAEGFKNNYLTLTILLALTLFSFTSFAQYDSTRNWQNVNGEGFNWKNGKFNGGFIIPRDTPRLAVRDSGGIAYKGGKFWIYDGYGWIETNSGTVVVYGSTIDSITFHNYTICSWFDGTPTCADQSLFHAGSSLNYNETKILYYNLNGDLLGDSVDLPHTNIYLVNIRQRDTLAGTHSVVLEGGRIDTSWISDDGIWRHNLYMSGAHDSTQLAVDTTGSGGTGSAVSSGIFTSTVTEVFNAVPFTDTIVMHWTKIDGNVHAYGYGYVSPGSSGLSALMFTLPINSPYTSGIPIGHATVGENEGASFASGLVYTNSHTTVTLFFTSTTASLGSYFITLDYPE